MVRNAVTRVETALVILVIILAIVAGAGFWQAATVTPTTETITRTETRTVTQTQTLTQIQTVTTTIAPGAAVTVTQTVTAPPTTVTVTAAPITTTVTQTVTAAPVTTTVTVTATPTPPKPIRIGLVLPLTGAAAPMGEPALKGGQLYAHIVNEVWGGIATLGGAKIELVVADTTTDPKVAASETERLITKENVIAIVGAFRSADTLPATEVAERYGVPWMVYAGHPLITARGFQYVFRAHAGVVPTTNWAVDVVKIMGHSTIAVLCENTAMGQSMYDMSLKRAGELGISVVLKELYSAGAPDLSPMLLKVKAAKPDVIVAGSYLTDALLIMRQMRELDVNVKAVVFIGGAIPPDTFLELGGRDVEYTMITAVWSPDSPRPASKYFVEMWKKLYGEGTRPDQQAAQVYEAMDVLVNAIMRAGSTDPKAIHDALTKTELISISGPVEFDATGENKYGYPNVHIIQVQKGEWVTVLPKEAATAAIIPVMPPWSAR